MAVRLRILNERLFIMTIKIFPLLCSSLLILSLFSCSKFLDETSPNDIDAATAIKDAASAEAALIGTYSALQNSSYYGGQYPLIGEALTDNASTGGYQFLSLDQLGSKAVTPANLLSEDMWIAIYRSIANANFLITALPNVSDLTAERKAQIEAQAKTIRALAHFDLLRYYGEHWNASSEFGIPVITKVQTITDRPTRATVAATYAAILSDLNQAATLLADTDDAPVQYINKYTVQALLARLHLYKGDRAAAASAAGGIITNTNYALLPALEYGNLFSTRQTTESIFELSFDAQNRSEFNGLTYSRDDAIRPELFYLAAAGLDVFFQGRPNDARATLLDFDPATNDVTIIPDGRTQKYRGESAKDNPAYIIRLAEMYLIRAEALGNVDGLADLNALRTTRGLSALDANEVATNEAWVQALSEERQAEFNFEGHRYFDLARWSLYSTVMGTDAYRAILPIPGREIAASGGVLTQNPGY